MRSSGGVDPVASIREFAPRLNYVHLQDYSASSRDADGTYQPVWCDVGEAEAVDFPAVLAVLAELGYPRWVTACPRRGDDPLTEARRSRKNARLPAPAGLLKRTGSVSDGLPRGGMLPVVTHQNPRYTRLGRVVDRRPLTNFVWR